MLISVGCVISFRLRSISFPFDQVLPAGVVGISSLAYHFLDIEDVVVVAAVGRGLLAAVRRVHKQQAFLVEVNHLVRTVAVGLAGQDELRLARPLDPGDPEVKSVVDQERLGDFAGRVATIEAARLAVLVVAAARQSLRGLVRQIAQVLLEVLDHDAWTLLVGRLGVDQVVLARIAPLHDEQELAGRVGRAHYLLRYEASIEADILRFRHNILIVIFICVCFSKIE